MIELSSTYYTATQVPPSQFFTNFEMSSNNRQLLSGDSAIALGALHGGVALGSGFLMAGSAGGLSIITLALAA